MTIYLYCRVSSAGQEDNTSLADQQERGRAFAKSQGWPEPVVLREVASGRDLARPALTELRAGVVSGDRVIVFKLDRLSRSIVTGAPLIEEWTRAGVGLHSISEPIETSTAMGRSMLRMILNFAETEREVIAERMAAGKEKNATSGKFNGSPIPYGYRRGGDSERDFEIVPGEAEVVRELFRRFAAGDIGVRRLRRLTGCRLSEAGIAELLSNPIHTGRIRHNGVVRFNGHDRIVSDRVFNSVQRAKVARAKSASLRVLRVRENHEEMMEISWQR